MLDAITDCDTTRARLELLGARTSIPFPASSVPDHFRRAAVLLLVGCQHGRPTLVLTERSSRMRAHAGEIALPGGRIEPGETPEQGAVREASEEVGVDPAAVILVGRLDEAWSKARNHVVPIAGWYDGDLTRLFPASEEVARVFLVALAEIADRSRHRVDVAELDGVTYENDIIDTDPCRIYGLTADLVLDLVAWLEGVERGRIPIRLAELQRSLGSG